MIKKLIPNSKNYYITSCGRVFKGNKELNKNTNYHGYITVTIIYQDGTMKPWYVHRLVAEYFIDNPENKPVVNHLNLIKSDNNVDNLEWCTTEENNRHAHENGAFMKLGVSVSAIHNLRTIKNVCLMLQEGRRNKDIFKITGVPTYTVSSIRNRQQWLHVSKDYIFKTPRTRRFSDSTAKWVCEKIVMGLKPIDIASLSNNRITTSTISDIKAKKSYKDISDKYF